MAEEDTKKAKFNAAIFQMKRIHDLQQVINICNMNLLGFSEEHNCYHFELKHRALGDLYSEARPKLKKPELVKDGDLFRDGIQAFMESNTVLKFRESVNYSKRTQHSFDKEAFTILRRELQRYEDKIREFLEKTDLQSPNIDMDMESLF